MKFLVGLNSCSYPDLKHESFDLSHVMLTSSSASIKPNLSRTHLAFNPWQSPRQTSTSLWHLCIQDHTVSHENCSFLIMFLRSLAALLFFHVTLGSKMTFNIQLGCSKERVLSVSMQVYVPLPLLKVQESMWNPDDLSAKTPPARVRADPSEALSKTRRKTFKLVRTSISTSPSSTHVHRNFIIRE